MRPMLGIVIPVYNEALGLQPVIRSWLELLDALALRESRGGFLLVVDDGSTDGSGALLDRIAARDARVVVLHQQNQGHGPAILRGYREALEWGAEYVFHVDSDGELDAADFFRLWDKRISSDFIVGYREVRRGSRHRLWISVALRAGLRLIFGVRLRDANSPYRLMRAVTLETLLPAVPQGVFCPNIFLSVLAAQREPSLVELPVRHRGRQIGVSSLRWKKLLAASVRSIKELFRFRFQLPQN